MNLIFFGSSEFSVYVLDELLLHKIKPSLIVTMPDKPRGRKLVVEPNEVKLWAINNSVDVITPASLKNNYELASLLKEINPDIFLVASYGKIIPDFVFNIPKNKTLNIHPSLLPKYRGPSPIQSQILSDEKNIGVTIMEISKEMDAGPIIVKKEIKMEKWPVGRIELEEILAKEGARTLVHILPEWIMGVIKPIPQNESEATYTKMIEKNDGLIDIDLNNLNKNSYRNLLKVKALEGWPGTFFYSQNKRIIIKEAFIKDGLLQIEKVVPEGKREMLFMEYIRGLK